MLEDGNFTETPDLNFGRLLQDVDLLPQVKTHHLTKGQHILSQVPALGPLLVPQYQRLVLPVLPDGVAEDGEDGRAGDGDDGGGGGGLDVVLGEPAQRLDPAGRGGNLTNPI